MLRVNEVEVKGINTRTKVDDENNETTKTLVDLVLPEGHPFALKTETNNDGDLDDYVRRSRLGIEINDELKNCLAEYVRREDLDSEMQDTLEHSDVLSSDDLGDYVKDNEVEEHISNYLYSANIITQDNAYDYLDLIDRDDVQRIVGEEILEQVHRCAIKPMYRPDDPDADGRSDSDSEPTITANTAAAPEVKALELKVENLEDDLFNLKNEYEGLKVTVRELHKSIRYTVTRMKNICDSLELGYLKEQIIKDITEQEGYEHESERSDTAA